jgi:hypothetical protein
MKKFSIRVELHSATSSDYVALAEHLRQRGIVDLITDENGVTYKLPPAEYNYVGDATLEQVFASVESAAKLTLRNYEIVASEAVRRRWIGLPLAQRAAA